MRIIAGQAALKRRGARSHYCPAARQTIGLLVEGLPNPANIFCPLCGALSPSEHDRHLYNGLRRPESYDGPLCEHGRPDATCVALAASDKSFQFEIEHTYCIPESGAAVLAARFGCAPTVIEWVRYCVECRHAFARAKLPALRHEIAVLHARAVEQSRAAYHALNCASDDIRSLSTAAEALERTGIADATTPDYSRMGFVYLIGHRSAVKIGWTAKHPAKGRLVGLQTATEKPLKLLGYALGTIEDERQLHRRFAAHRIRGEWFQPAQEIVAYFQQKES